MKLLFCSLLFILVGIIFIVTGILNRGIKNRKAAIWIGGGFAAVGTVTLAVTLFCGEDRVLFTWAVCMALIMFTAALHLTVIVFRCNEMVIGIYAGSNRYSGSHGTAGYGPVFTY